MCVLCKIVRQHFAWRKVSGRYLQDTQNKTGSTPTHTPKTKKTFRRMATLKDLCSSVPQSLLRAQAIYNVNQRKQAAYNKRMERLGMERAIFEQCKRTRAQKRVKNKFSTEEAGTCSQTTSTRRFATSQMFVEKRGKSVRTYTLTSYTNVVCKSYSNKY